MIVITWPENIQGEHHLINAMLDRGLQALHVRKPGLDTPGLRAFLRGIRAEHHPRVMLHGGYDLLHEFPCRGVHFAAQHQHRFSEFAGRAIIRSWPVHRVDRVAGVPDGVHYILMSPVFPSISKKGYRNHWPHGEPQEHLRNHRDPRLRYIALGGIDLLTAPRALAMGFDGFAVLGALWEPFRAGGRLEAALPVFLALQRLCAEGADSIPKPSAAPLS